MIIGRPHFPSPQQSLMGASKISQIGSPGPSSGPAYEFGPFRLEPENRLLRRGDKAVPLTPKAFDSLLFLIAHDGRLVTKDQLMAAVWPDAVVCESNLTQTIFMLRKALGESATEQRFIVTVPGSGYRFAASAQTRSLKVLTSAAATEVPGQSGAIARPVFRIGTWSLAGLLLLVGIAALSRAVAPLPQPRVRRVALLPASNHATPWEPLMTDGARVYFLELDGAQANLMQTSVAGRGESYPVPTPFPDFKLFDISRDHSTFIIGDFAGGQDVVPLWLWPAQGGTPVRVGEILAEDASWHFDGKDILYARGKEIRIVGRNGSGDRLFLRAPGKPRVMRWSPDGKRLRFAVYAGSKDNVDIWEAAADGSGAHILKLGNEGHECCGEWTPDGRYYIYTVFANGVDNLWAVRERGEGIHWGAELPVQLTSGATSVYGGLPVSNDRLFTFVEARTCESVRFDLKTHELRPFFPDKPILSLSFSPDGKRMAYEMFPDGSLWYGKADSGDGVEIVAPPMRAARPGWSPDGKMIAFESYVRGKGMRAYVMKAEGGPAVPVLARDVQQSLPVWSADGKSLAVAVNVLAPEAPAADRGVFLVDQGTQRATKLPGSEGLTSPMWSPDGKHFIARTPDNHDIVQWDSETKSWTKILSGRQLAGPLWSSDSKYLYYQDVLDTGQPVFRLRISDLKREKIFGFDKVLAGGIRKALIQAVAPDGSLIISLMRSGVAVHAVDLDLP